MRSPWHAPPAWETPHDGSPLPCLCALCLVKGALRLPRYTLWEDTTRMASRHTRHGCAGCAVRMQKESGMPVPTFASLTRPQRDTRLRDPAAPVPSPAPAAACHAWLAGDIAASLGHYPGRWRWSTAAALDPGLLWQCASETVLHLFRGPLTPPADPRAGRAPHSRRPPADHRHQGPSGLCPRGAVPPRAPETVIIHPCNRETGAGILLPLLHIVQRDPRAIAWRSSPPTTLSSKSSSF